MKMIFDKLFNIFLIFLFGLFLSIMITTQLINFRYDLNLKFYLVILLFSIILSYFLIFVVIKNKNVEFNLNTTEKKNNKLIFILFFLALLIPIMLYFYAYFPGYILVDNFEQILTGLGFFGHSSWRPWLDTDLFFKIPLLFIKKLWFLNLYQIILFCFAYSYLFTKMYKYGCNKVYLLLTYILFILNFYFIEYLIFPIKDVHFTIFAIMLSAYFFEIYHTNGKWINNFKNIFIFLIFIIICQFIKRNGILFIFPILIYSFFKCDKKHKYFYFTMYIFLLSIFSIISTKIYVDDYDYVGESCGYSINVFGYVLQKDAGSLPLNVYKEINRIFPEEMAKEYFILGSANNLKFRSDGLSYMKKIGFSKTLMLTFQCFRYSPKYSFTSLFYLIGMPLGIYVNYYDGARTTYELNISDLYKNYDNINIDLNSERADGLIYNIYNKINKVYDNFLVYILFGSYGLKILILCFIFIIYSYNRNAKLILSLPLIFHHFGTLLLLTDDFDYRYFIVTIPLFLPYLYMILCKNNNDICKKI